MDAAVFTAYGWQPTLSDEELLEKLVALNAERGAEEANGIIRWLRPAYQKSCSHAHRYPKQGIRSRGTVRNGFLRLCVAVSYLAVPFDCAQDMLCGFAASRRGELFVPPYAQRVAVSGYYAHLQPIDQTQKCRGEAVKIV